MSIRDYNKVIIITDATTGDIIQNIKIRLFKEKTILDMIGDILVDDKQNEHGILIKYGIEP